MVPTSNLQEFILDLRKEAAGEVRTDDYSRVLYSTDASIYQVMPFGVFFPKNTADLQAAVTLANRYQVPLLPRTAGSSLAGQAVNEALVMDMTRYLDQILELNVEENWVRVAPGIVLDELNLALAPHNLQFGPDPASSNRAALGGIVANNSTGAHSILYGMTADHVIETEVLLSDGTQTSFGPIEREALAPYLQKEGLEGRIYKKIFEICEKNAEAILANTPHHWRRCGGYNLDRFVDGATFKVPFDPRFNLAKMMAGSEGTLAIMTGIKLNLLPRPTKTALAIIHYESLNAALESVPTILEVEPSAVELLDNLGLTMCREVPEYARLLTTFVHGTPNCVLITEFYGESDQELEHKVGRLTDHLKAAGNQGYVVPIFPQLLQNNVWTVRKVGLGLLMSIKGDYKPVPFIEDAAVPPEHLAEYVTRIEKFCNDIGTDVAYYAHASAGCVHIRPLINTKDATDIAKLPEITSFSVELLGEFGGAFSSEHGDGRARSWLNERFFGKELYGLFKEVKEVFDPENLLNPGNIVDGPAMTADLRFGDDYQVIPLKEHLDFTPDIDFFHAVEMCNGAGICRKKTTGTMCPSFMVTREEEHSTRGRANALRAAFSGTLPPEEFTSARMFEVMDLCIECKACKAECPSSVDMAKIKFEYLGQYYDKNAVPLRTRLFGDFSRWTRLSSGSLAPMANWVLGNGLVRWGLEKGLGIGRQHEMPQFAPRPFTAWFNQRSSGRGRKTGRRDVVLFNDTFNTYNDPDVSIAATLVLESAGFKVHLPGHQCCGRPMISKGLVAKARQAAKETVDRLAPYAEQGIPIVGLEPSCLLSFRDEYLYMLPDDPRVQLVAENSFLFEEFIAGLEENGELNLDLTDEHKRLKLHGHCHQKALVGTGPTEKALTLPKNYQVEVVDSGCCGMAGAFGYEAEHYEHSIAMGERRLLPAVREAAADDLIVAPGFSCRHQINHGAAREALHPAQVLHRALKS